jgi:hypothetical protein
MKWIRVIQDAIEGMNPGLSLLEVTNIVIERFGDSRVVNSSEADEQIIRTD